MDPSPLQISFSARFEHRFVVICVATTMVILGYAIVREAPRSGATRSRTIAYPPDRLDMLYDYNLFVKNNGPMMFDMLGSPIQLRNYDSVVG